MGDARSHVGPRYLGRFRCIAERCEDPCCSDWEVPVDQVHYDALRAAMGGSAEEQAEFTAALADRPDPARRSVALMVLRPDRSCAMLGADQLCTIHRRYGEALLPDTCAIYPRSVGQVGDRVESSASLSCPEAARLCLLAEDAMETVPLPPELVVRGQTHRRLAAPRSLAEAAFDDVRALANDLLSARRYPLDSRLFSLAVFAERAVPLLRPEAGAREGTALHGLLQMLRQEAVLDQLHEQCGAIAVPEPFAATVVGQLLVAAGRRGPASFRALLQRVLGTYAGPGDGEAATDPATGLLSDPVALWAAYEARRRTISSEQEARADEIVTNFCLNHWLRDWYLRAPDLRAYGLGLLVRVAAVRFLLRSHPAAGGDGEGRSAFDAAAVEVVHTLSRALDHEAAMLKGILDSMAEQGMQTLSHAVCLLKF